MRYETVPKEFFIRNRENLRGLLKPNSIVIVQANDIYPTNADGTMVFKQHNDLFHLTGIDQEETTLVMLPGAVDPKEREVIFVRETNEHIAIWEGAKLTKDQVRQVSGIERVEWNSEMDGLLHRLITDFLYIQFQRLCYLFHS